MVLFAFHEKVYRLAEIIEMPKNGLEFFGDLSSFLGFSESLVELTRLVHLSDIILNILLTQRSV
jgi:hypothetical protein